MCMVLLRRFRLVWWGPRLTGFLWSILVDDSSEHVHAVCNRNLIFAAFWFFPAIYNKTLVSLDSVQVISVSQGRFTQILEFGFSMEPWTNFSSWLNVDSTLLHCFIWDIKWRMPSTSPSDSEITRRYRASIKNLTGFCVHEIPYFWARRFWYSNLGWLIWTWGALHQWFRQQESLVTQDWVASDLVLPGLDYYTSMMDVGEKWFPNFWIQFKSRGI
jgi:hypothetical protein